MKAAAVAASIAIATLAPLASAAGYQAAWTIQGDTCDGQVSVGEYTPTSGTCVPKDCAPIPGGVPGLSTKTQCVATRADATKVILADYTKPYVLVEVYTTGSECTGAFETAVGVIADGTCYSGSNGLASYNVTWSAETGTVWRQYADALCQGESTKVEISNAEADGKSCLYKFIKAFAVAPSAEGGNTTAPVGAAGNTSKPSTTAPTIAPTPAPTTSAASPSVSVSVAVAVSVSVMAAIASAVV